MLHQAAFSALASVLLLASTQAQAVVINFDNLPVGTTLSNQYAALGATFSANAFSGTGSSSSGYSWATNTDMTIVAVGGGNTDANLGTPTLASGNLLRSFQGWINENGDPSFKITFSGSGATSVAMSFAGVSDGFSSSGSGSPSDVRLFVYNGSTLLATVAGFLTTGQFTLGYSAPAITSVIVAPGSGVDWVGVDNVNFTLATAAVPEASTYLMMASGMLVLAFRRRRRG